VEATAPTPQPAPDPRTGSGQTAAGWTAVDASLDLGLHGLRAHLDRVLEAHGLRSLTVVVDDPDLGRQAFRTGRGPLEPGIVAAGPGCFSDPPFPHDLVDAELLVALCATSLRVDVLRVDSTRVDVRPGDARDITELALRRLPGVYAVVMEHDGDVTLCRLLASADAPDDVARQAATALASESRLVIELVRDPASNESASGAPPAAGASIDATRDRPISPELLSVRSVPEDGEIEVHLAVGAVRVVGRAPLARGLVGAADAVVAAVGEADPATQWAPSWIRTVETTASGSFVVAVALVELDTTIAHHGIATGTSPVEAAARATVDALRVSTRAW
jgi:hypothetical protein